MAMPPPLEPEKEKPDDHRIPQIDLSGIAAKINKLGLSDYLFAFGAGLRAFHEARKRRNDHDTEN